MFKSMYDANYRLSETYRGSAQLVYDEVRSVALSQRRVSEEGEKGIHYFSFAFPLSLDV